MNIGNPQFQELTAVMVQAIVAIQCLRQSHFSRCFASWKHAVTTKAQKKNQYGLAQQEYIVRSKSNILKAWKEIAKSWISTKNRLRAIFKKLQRKVRFWA